MTGSRHVYKLRCILLVFANSGTMELIMNIGNKFILSKGIAMTIARILAIGIFASVFLGLYADAQTGVENVKDRRAQLESSLSEIEKEIEAQKQILQKKQRESVSLERDVAILDAQINKSELSIRARSISINGIVSDIEEKNRTINVLSDKLEREKESLAQLLRKTNEIDSFSLVEVMFSNENLSEFFVDLDSFDAIKKGLQKSFVKIEETKGVTERQKKKLEEDHREEIELKRLQVLQQRKIESTRKERSKILSVTKGQENIYKKVLKEKERTAAEIRNELFSLRDTAAIPFGEAVDMALRVSDKTGVRAALVLGIITQESNLGENTGQCLLTNKPQKGDGKGKNTGRFFSKIMKPSRDVDPFMALSERVGFDPFNTPVSCPPSYGYGGAMGPAQFIPSTWILFEKKIGKSTGNIPPNPWNPEDAFTASAMLLKDNGAARGGFANERLAALRYFAGWKNAKNPRYAFYGDNVMELTNKIQKQIDILQAD